jgi:RluA family pseudouridine synthase
MNPPKAARMTEAELVSRILYRDGLILVLNKPSGIPVHPAGPCLHNLEQYFDLLRFGLPKVPHLAHRLDLGTSGCLVLARNAHAARRMQQLFVEGKIKKTYLAVVHGAVLEERGQIDIPLSKQSQAKTSWRMKADKNGTITALTDYEVLTRTAEWSLLRLTPHTGRTHQLRVHCLALGHPIVGDYVYGPPQDGIKPLHLHAHTIEIPLYDKKAPIVVTAPMPEHMVAATI